MQIELSKPQFDFFNAKEPIVLFRAGFASGKSFIATLKAITLLIEHPHNTFAYFLPTYGLIRDIAYPNFTELLETLGVKYTLNKSAASIKIKGGGEIHFRSMQDPSKIVGTEYAGIFIDEADLLPKHKMEEIYIKILGRNRQPLKDKNSVILDKPNPLFIVSTPESYNFLYSLENRLDNKSKIVVAETTSNKFVPASYIENLKEQYPDNVLKAYLGGEYVNLQNGNVYEYFNRDTHVQSFEIPSEINEINVGVDFNIGYCALTLSFESAGVIKVFDSVGPPNVFAIREYLTDIVNKYNTSRINIYPDSSGGLTNSNSSRVELAELRKIPNASVIAGKRNPGVTDTIVWVNKLFQDNKIVVHPNAIKLIESLEQQAWDDNGSPQKFGGAGTVDDINDSLRYLIYNKYHKHNNKVINRRMV